jgi:hypothetical protein
LGHRFGEMVDKQHAAETRTLGRRALARRSSTEKSGSAWRHLQRALQGALQATSAAWENPPQARRLHASSAAISVSWQMCMQEGCLRPASSACRCPSARKRHRISARPFDPPCHLVDAGDEMARTNNLWLVDGAWLAAKRPGPGSERRPAASSAASPRRRHALSCMLVAVWDAFSPHGKRRQLHSFPGRWIRESVGSLGVLGARGRPEQDDSQAGGRGGLSPTQRLP